MAFHGGSAIMSHNAWSRGVRYDHAPLCSGDTALQYFQQVDQLEDTHGGRKFHVYDIKNEDEPIQSKFIGNIFIANYLANTWRHLQILMHCQPWNITTLLSFVSVTPANCCYSTNKCMSS